MLYSFYVAGPFDRVTNMFPVAVIDRFDTVGVWEGVEEPVTVFTADMSSDFTAQATAYAIARYVGEDYVLVARGRETSDDAPMRSLRRFFTSPRIVTEGNRTIIPSVFTHSLGLPVSAGMRYESDPKGEQVAWLVTSDGTLEPVR